MLVWMEQFLVRYPELALFLVLAAGYWIGSFKIGAVGLGPVAGALFAGLLDRYSGRSEDFVLIVRC
jgi:putative transport protein